MIVTSFLPQIPQNGVKTVVKPTKPTLNDDYPIGTIWVCTGSGEIFVAVAKNDLGTEWIGTFGTKVQAIPPAFEATACNPCINGLPCAPNEAFPQSFTDFTLVVGLKGFDGSDTSKSQFLFTLHRDCPCDSNNRSLIFEMNSGVGQCEVQVYDANGNLSGYVYGNFPSSISEGVVVVRGYADTQAGETHIEYNIVYYDTASKSVKTTYANNIQTEVSGIADYKAVVIGGLDNVGDYSGKGLLCADIIDAQFFYQKLDDNTLEAVVQSVLSKMYPELANNSSNSTQ